MSNMSSPKILRLWQVNQPDGKIYTGVFPMYFETRMDARKVRDERNRRFPGHCVSYGPDHKRRLGFKLNRAKSMDHALRTRNGRRVLTVKRKESSL